MSYTPNIIAFAGSLREGSWNKKLVQIAAEGAKRAGANVTYADLKDYPMPVFDEDLEGKDKMPEGARGFKELLQKQDGFLIASPEYNSSMTAALKNAVDWASRDVDGGGDLSAFTGKTAALMSTSPGGLGGLRGLVHLRALLGNIGVTVLPEQRAVASAFQAFNEDGSLKDAKQQEAIEGLGATLVDICKKLYA